MMDRRLHSTVLFFLGLSALVLAGCESGSVMPNRMRERFAAPQPKVRTFEADQPVVFEAAKSALRQLDFQVSRSGMAQGILNGYSRLQAGDGFGKARQYVMEIQLQSYEPAKTEVAVVVREQEESSSFAGATDLALKEHGLYESFYAALEQALRERSGGEYVPKP